MFEQKKSLFHKKCCLIELKRGCCGRNWSEQWIEISCVVCLALGSTDKTFKQSDTINQCELGLLGKWRQNKTTRVEKNAGKNHTFVMFISDR